MGLNGLALNPKETALLVIDMQNGFCHPKGTLGQARGEETVAKPAAIVPKIVKAMKLCRELGVRIWLTRQVHYEGDKGRDRHLIQSHLDRGAKHLELCWRGTWDSELVDQIAAEIRPEDEVLIKHRASAFYNSPLEVELRMRGIQVLVITGTTTSFCVDSTIRDAYARDFDVAVPVECVADRDEAAQQAVFEALKRYHGAITDLAELEASLLAGRRHA